EVARGAAADLKDAGGDVVQLALRQPDLAGRVGAHVDLPAGRRVLQGGAGRVAADGTVDLEGGGGEGDGVCVGGVVGALDGAAEADGDAAAVIRDADGAAGGAVDDAAAGDGQRLRRRCRLSDADVAAGTVAGF